MEESELTQRSAQSRAGQAEDVAQLKRDEMSRLLERTRILIRPEEFSKWRPTIPTRGEIPGLPVAVICLATDGNLGMFETTADEGHNLGRFFLGHVQHFQWSEPVVSTITYYDKAAKRYRQAKITKESGAPGPKFSLPKQAKPHTDPKPKKETKKAIRARMILDL